MRKTKSTKDKYKYRNLARIAFILVLSLFVSIILCRNEASANNKILDKTVYDAFAFKSMMIEHYLDPNPPGDFTDISSLEDTNDTESFVSDAAIKTGASQYYIRVNYGANCVNIYTKDDEGNYTKPYKSMICSSGKSTPKSGTYKISYKYRWLSLYGGVYGQYSTRIVGSILFHSVPYYKQRADSLEYEEYDKLGTKASLGCIRLTVQDAKWIYDNIPSGTYVEFYSDEKNPGPLGKPSAKKISAYTENRNWDPTDPDKNNPWTGGSGIPTVTYTPSNYTNNSNKKTNTNSDNSSNKTIQKNDINETPKETVKETTQKQEEIVTPATPKEEPKEEPKENTESKQDISNKEEPKETTSPEKDEPASDPKPEEKTSSDNSGSESNGNNSGSSETTPETPSTPSTPETTPETSTTPEAEATMEENK